MHAQMLPVLNTDRHTPSHSSGQVSRIKSIVWKNLTSALPNQPDIVCNTPPHVPPEVTEHHHQQKKHSTPRSSRGNRAPPTAEDVWLCVPPGRPLWPSWVCVLWGRGWLRDRSVFVSQQATSRLASTTVPQNWDYSPQTFLTVGGDTGSGGGP